MYAKCGLLHVTRVYFYYLYLYLVLNLGSKEIVNIACGQSSSMAIDNNGEVCCMMEFV